VVAPRWRPYSGVSDVNPSFRTQAPTMNSQGYANIIWKNARKSDKPSLMRHSLRIYDKMEKASREEASTNRLVVRTTTVHHEGALVACAKLGMWEKAMQIFINVESQSEEQKTARELQRRSALKAATIEVTDNMVLSLIKACVKGSKSKSIKLSDGSLLEQRRAPLDAALNVVGEMEQKYGLPLVARHLNPLAVAYQGLGLYEDAARILDIYLEDRKGGPEDEYGGDRLNVHDVRAKDKGSYTIIVKGAVSERDWSAAVSALRTMTDAGLYPSSRHLNAWTEVGERKTKHRATRSWKKKRDEYWMKSVGYAA